VRLANGFPGRQPIVHLCCLVWLGFVHSIQIGNRQNFALFRSAHQPSVPALRTKVLRLGRVQVVMSAAGYSQHDTGHKSSLDGPFIVDSPPPLVNNNTVVEGALANAATSSTNADAAVWDPVQQIYVGGVIPEHESVRELLENTQRGLSVFGYGSLCWNPGQDGDAVLSHPSVTTALGRAANYRRCWAQRSTDHRGTPDFPGIVCTLLKVDEVQPLLLPAARRTGSERDGQCCPETTDTLGRVYHVPPELVEPCLNELDFREKGGYARDVIDVHIEDEDVSGRRQDGATSSSTSSDKAVRALLYRGTLDNPAMWLRPLQDLTFAAGKDHWDAGRLKSSFPLNLSFLCPSSAVMSVAVGPSGENLEYLERLDSFLTHRRLEGTSSSDSNDSGNKSDDTTALSKLARRLRDNYGLFFLLGAGSNQHSQLMLRKASPNVVEMLHEDDDGCAKIDSEEVHGLKELVAACTQQGDAVMPDLPPRDAGPDLAVDLLAGGGHTGILTSSGRLFLVGWNESGQLGRSPVGDDADESHIANAYEGHEIPMPIILKELSDVRVETASLGFSHTLIVEKGTGRLFGFGSNEKGQVLGCPNDPQSNSSWTASVVHVPSTPSWAMSTDERFISVAAGVFHSAAVTNHGELCLWGCPRSIGLDRSSSRNSNWVYRWKPRDGSRLVKVACGRKHTVAVDDRNRVWTVGDNRHGQLGRAADDAKRGEPEVVVLDSTIGSSSYRVESISCGWSHTVILTKCLGDDTGPGSTRVYGWGRNDRGQLGTGSADDVRLPRRLFETHNVQSIDCGSEFTAVVCANDSVWSCGWNEHGNLATGDSRDRFELVPAAGVSLGGASSTPPIGRPPSYPENSPVRVAAGGSHLVVMRVAEQPTLSAFH
jgi:alpha-tubulin suppressor-like RCC1 family protein/cation transport regulator ChaC